MRQDALRETAERVRELRRQGFKITPRDRKRIFDRAEGRIIAERLAPIDKGIDERDELRGDDSFSREVRRDSKGAERFDREKRREERKTRKEKEEREGPVRIRGPLSGLVLNPRSEVIEAAVKKGFDKPASAMIRMAEGFEKLNAQVAGISEALGASEGDLRRAAR